MLVAWITNHLRNGFFIFRPGEGYEYVMTLTLVALGLGGLGAGEWSVDDALDVFQPGAGRDCSSQRSPAGAGLLRFSRSSGGVPRRPADGRA